MSYAPTSNSSRAWSSGPSKDSDGKARFTGLSVDHPVGPLTNVRPAYPLNEAVWTTGWIDVNGHYWELELTKAQAKNFRYELDFWMADAKTVTHLNSTPIHPCHVVANISLVGKIFFPDLTAEETVLLSQKDPIVIIFMLTL